MTGTIKIFLLTAFLLYVISTGFVLPCCAEDMGGPAVGDTAENFSLTDASGKTIELKSYSGKKAVLIVFWASW